MEKPEFVSRAEDALDRRTEAAPGERKYGEAAPADRAGLRAEQQDEAAQSWAGFGVLTDGMAKGVVVGTVVGGLIGALVFLPLAFIPLDVPFWVRLAGALVLGALAGSTAAALYLGGRAPELEGETLDADGRPSVGTTLRDPGTDERGR
jgi:hypothetical protein